MVIHIRNRDSNPISNLEKAVCIKYSANTFRKGMKPIILTLAMGN